MHIPDIISALLGFGLVGVGFLSAFEKFVPLAPSYILLLFLGMTVADPAMLLMTILVSTFGSLIGGFGWYGLGRALGAQRADAFVAAWGRYVLLRTSLYRRLTDAYRHDPFWVTLIAQTIPGARIYIGLPAGVLALRYRTYLAATLLGGMIWNACFLTLGYVLRGSGRELAGIGAWTAAILVALEFVLLFVLRRFGTSNPAPAQMSRQALGLSVDRRLVEERQL
jgi:alkaline phosphatase